MDFDTAVVHGDFPGFAINSHWMFLFPVIGRGNNFIWKPQSLQRHPASVHPRMEAHLSNSIKHN